MIISNMSRKLLLSGLIFIPFYELIIYSILPSGKLPEWVDFRITKEYIAIGMALILTAWIWNSGKKISCPNKWMLFFLIFLWFNFSKTPIAVANPIVDLSLIGRYSAEFKVFSFFLMFCSLSSVRIDVKKIMRVIMMCSIVMAGYMILQSCNLDQIFKPKPEYFHTDVTALRVAGFFGQPTLTVGFIAMGIPLAIYFKNWFGVCLLTVAAMLTGSAFAVGSIVVLIAMYSFSSKKKWMIAFGCLLVASCIALYFLKPHDLFTDNGRFRVWTMILKDVFSGEINNAPVRIGLFGAGLNNFGEIFTALHTSAYTFAHNDYLQVLWCCGVTGLFLVLAIHYDVFKTAWQIRAIPEIKAVSFSLILLCFCACGTFVFQLGVYQVYVVVLASLIYQIKAQQAEVKNGV